MINILTRTHRIAHFKTCVESVKRQTYTNVRMIVSVDREELFVPTLDVLDKSGLNFEVIRVDRTGVQYNWNFYCNNLKSRVKEGWFFYLDDDDCIADKFSLSLIRPHLSDEHGTICQFLRKNRPKPHFPKKFWMDSEHVVQGRIGGSCIFLHHTHKDMADWDGERAADYRFIRDVQKQLPLQFVPQVVVRALNNGRHGK